MASVGRILVVVNTANSDSDLGSRCISCQAQQKKKRGRDKTGLYHGRAEIQYNGLWRLLALLCMRLTYQALARTVSEVSNLYWRRACINDMKSPVIPDSLELVPFLKLVPYKTRRQNTGGLFTLPRRPSSAPAMLAPCVLHWNIGIDRTESAQTFTFLQIYPVRDLWPRHESLDCSKTENIDGFRRGMITEPEPRWIRDGHTSSTYGYERNLL
jgi:hypothetical protein